MATCRKKTTQTDAGPSQAQKKKKKTTTKKPKTPVKKKLKRAEANPSATVVTSITKLVFEGSST